MAYTAYNQEEEKDQAQTAPVAPMAAPGVVGGVGTGGVAGAAPAGAGAASGAPAAKGPGRQQFLGFDAYFNANKDAANRMAQSAANKVETAATGAQKAVAGEVADAKKQVAAGVHTPTVGITNEGDPTRMVHNGAYTGPTSWNVSDATKKQLSDAAGMARNLGSLSGRQNVIGGNRFDAALAGAAGGGRFRELAQRFGGLGASGAQAAGEVEGEIQSAKAKQAELTAGAERRRAESQTALENVIASEERAFDDSMRSTLRGMGWPEDWLRSADRNQLAAELQGMGIDPHNPRSTDGVLGDPLNQDLSGVDFTGIDWTKRGP